MSKDDSSAPRFITVGALAAKLAADAPPGSNPWITLADIALQGQCGLWAKSRRTTYQCQEVESFLRRLADYWPSPYRIDIALRDSKGQWTAIANFAEMELSLDEVQRGARILGASLPSEIASPALPAPPLRTRDPLIDHLCRAAVTALRNSDRSITDKNILSWLTNPGTDLKQHGVKTIREDTEKIYVTDDRGSTHEMTKNGLRKYFTRARKS